MTIKICKLCKNEYNTTKSICDDCRRFHCLNCNREFMRAPKEIEINRSFCSTKCAQSSKLTKDKIKKANEEKYGGTGFQIAGGWDTLTEEEKSERKRVMKEGLVNHLSKEENREKIKEKRELTNIKKFGAKSPLSKESSIRNKIDNNRNTEEISKKTQLAKSKWSDSKRMEINEKIKKSNKLTWSSTDEKVKMIRSTKISTSRKLFFENETHSERIKRKENHKKKINEYWGNLPLNERFKLIQMRQETLSKSKKKRVSNINKHWADLIKEKFNVTPIFEKSVNGMNYDLYIDNLLIDINPTVSHNSDINFAHFTGICKDPYCEKHKLIDKFYHLNRAINANENGYDWIFIFDNLDEKKVLDMIGSKLKKSKRIFYGRKLSIQEIDKKDAKDFIHEYHLLGERKFADVNLGLFNENELISVMSFKLLSKGDWELKRFVSKQDTAIVGGPEKLFKYFILNFNPNTIKTFADYNLGNAELYPRLNFKLIKDPKPSLFWMNINTNDYLNNNSLLLGADRVIKSWANKNGLDYFHVGQNFIDFKENGGMTEFKELYESGVISGKELPSNQMIATHYGFVRIYDCGYQTFLWERGNN